MKRKTNISVQDNRGIKTTANMIVGDTFNGYSSGDILDANAIVELVYNILAGQGVNPQGVVTSEQIENNTIKLEDLSNEVINRFDNTGSATYNSEQEEIQLSGFNNN